NDNIAITTSFMCLEDRDEARQWMTKSGNGRQQSLVFKYLDTFPKPAWVPEWPEVIPDPTLEQIAAGVESGARVGGTPHDCPGAAADALQQWFEMGAARLCRARWGSVSPHDLRGRTVKLFGDGVIPRFDTDPEPSPSRYRRLAAGA